MNPNKKTKYSTGIKILCFVLTVVFFMTSIFSLITISNASNIYGFKNYINGEYGTYTSCDAFKNTLRSHMSYLYNITENNSGDNFLIYESKREEIVNNALLEYKVQKANIIHSELIYAVENYDDAYYNYDDSAGETFTEAIIEQSSNLSESTTLFETERYEAADDAPKNVKNAVQVLNTVTGTDILQYESLVRNEAFYETPFEYSTYITKTDSNVDSYNNIKAVNFSLDNYGYTESEAKEKFESTYSNTGNDYFINIDSDNEKFLYGLKNFHYYINTGSTVQKKFTNLGNEPTIDEVKNHKVYAVWDGEKATVSGIDSTDFASEIKRDLTSACSNHKCIVYVYLDNNLTGNDVYGNILSAFAANQKFDADLMITAAVVSIILAIIFMIILISSCGHKNGEKEIKKAFIDKLPPDIHLIISSVLIIGILTILIQALDSIYLSSDDWFFYSKYYTWIVSGSLTVCWMLFIEFVTSTLRIHKSNTPYFKSMLTVKLFTAIGRGFAALGRAVSYKPKKFKRTAVFAVLGFFLINTLLASVASAASDGFVIFLFIMLMLIFNGVCLIFIEKYVKDLDTIIDASSNHQNVDFGNEKVAPSLEILSHNLTNVNSALNDAVTKAVKDEQMKTELITNVSHDLKTPLTSLISYSDLLGKCDISDSSAKKYIGIINDQSIKLKRLIEDLIEASKVSTGNVTINKTKLNLCELSVQTIAEFAPEMEKNGNEIKFSEPDTAPYIMADGSKTYRIMSNLMSNAKKYSASGTRVYVSVYSDDNNGYFEIKNISSEPLNISADELTERFIRGDKSRTHDGNGLGLSIAKDLCTLQDGELKISIDGDLFKVIIRLPAAEKNKEEDTNNESAEPLNEETPKTEQ